MKRPFFDTKCHRSSSGQHAISPLFFRDKIVHRTPVYDARTFLNFGRNFTNPGEKPFFLSKIAHTAPSSSSGGTQPNTKPSPSPQIKPRPVHRALILPMPGTLKSGQQLMLLAGETVNKVVNSPRWKGRVCAGNPRRVSCAIEIISFQNFYKSSENLLSGAKKFFCPAERPAANAAGRENFIFFRCPLDGQRFTHCATSLKIFYISA